MIHLSILVFFPVVCGLLSAFNARIIGLIATLIPLVYALTIEPLGLLAYIATTPYKLGASAPQTV